MNNRDFLRKTTQEIHQSLDSQIVSVGIFENAANYCNFLKCMAAMHFQFAGSCRKVALSAGLPERTANLSACLTNDIVSANESLEEVESNSVVQTIATDSQASAYDWGCAYAIEGSANGARYMRKSAAEKLPANFEYQYLTQMAWDAENRWPPFVMALNDQSEIDLKGLELGATEVFRFVKEQADQLFPA